MPINLVYHHNPPDITEPWQYQCLFPIVRVDGNIQEALKYDLIRKFVPLSQYETTTGQQIGIYRWMRTLLSINIKVAKDKLTVYSQDTAIFVDIFHLYLGGAKQVFLVWDLALAPNTTTTTTIGDTTTTTTTSKSRIFHVSIDHAEAVYNASRGLEYKTAPEHAVFVPPKNGRTPAPKTKEGEPCKSWIRRTVPTKEFFDQDAVNLGNVAPRTHNGKTNAVPHSRWPVAPML